MKYFKLTLLALPLFVMADNPVAPADLDSAEQKSSSEPAQVSDNSQTLEIKQFESSSTYSESEGIEDIIVTATKRESKLMVTPIAVTVLSQDQLDIYGIRQVTDLSSLIPNMQVGTSAEDSGVSIAIRGMSSNNYTEIGDPTVSLHVDGMYTPRPQAALALMHDIERVEVLRGPQGTLFGRNSTAGAINIISARPQFGSEVTGRIGFRKSLDDRDMNEIDGFVNLPINDEMAVRASFKSTMADSFINQTVDRYDWSLDYNKDGKTGTNTSGPGGPNQGTVTWVDGRDIVADGIPNVDQRRAREVDASDAYYNLDNYAARFSFFYDSSDSDFEWLLTYDTFQDDGAGSIYLKDCEQANVSKGTAYDFSCDGNDPFSAAINNPGEIDMSIDSLRSEMKFAISDEIVGELRIAFTEHERFQISDGDGGFHTSTNHPAYGFQRLHPGSMGINADAAAGNFGGLFGTQYGWGPRAGVSRFGLTNDVYARVQAWEFNGTDTSWGNEWNAADPNQNCAIDYNNGNPYIHSCKSQWWMNDPDAVSQATGATNGRTLAQYVKPMWFDEMYRTQQEMESTVVEFQLKSESSSELQWVGGVFYMKEDNASRFDVEMPFLGPIIRPLLEIYDQPDRSIESYAIFGQIDYAVNERLNLTAGYRHTWDEKTDSGGRTYKTHGYFEDGGLYCASDCFWFESYDFVGNTTLVNPLFTFVPFDVYQSDDLNNTMGIAGSTDLSRFTAKANNDYSAEWDQGTWKLGGDYIINNDLFVYGSIATGYKAGGFGDNIDRGDGQFINFEYDPEINTTYELGFKSVHLNGDLKLLGNIFYSDYEDMQRTLFGFVGYRELDGQAIYTLMTKNVLESEISGAELEFDWTPYQNGRIFGWVSLLDAQNGGSSSSEATQDGYLCLERAILAIDPCAADNSINLDGKNLTWSPEVSATVQFEHNYYGSNNKRYMSILSVSHVGEMFFNETNYDIAPFHSGSKARTTANLSLVYIDQRADMAVEFYIHNLTDELIKTDSYPSNAGFVKAMYAPPKSWGIRIQKDF